jgi:hypothetical protein
LGGFDRVQVVASREVGVLVNSFDVGAEPSLKDIASFDQDDAAMPGAHIRPKVAEFLRMFRDATAAAPPRCDRDPSPTSRTPLRPALALALRYAAEQVLLPRRLEIEGVREGLPGDVG